MNRDIERPPKLDSRQTRRFYLAGTTPFPTAFPSVGVISIELGSLFYSARDASKSKEDALFVVVKEPSYGDEAVSRVVLQKDVGAIFFHGSMEGKNGKKVFRFSDADRVEDFEKGEWFFTPDINIQVVKDKLNVKEAEISGQKSIARGIIFVPKDRPVLTVTISEVIEPAGCTYATPPGCECKAFCECTHYW